MNDYGKRDCTPTENPANQPHPPVKNCKECEPSGGTTPPTWHEPEPCKPPENCNCPSAPPNTKNCLEKAIDLVNQRLVQADKASKFKEELTNRLTAATKAAQEYTQDQYQKLLKRWQDEDSTIVELLKKLTCTVHCWQCVIECYVCPILNTMRDAEQRLNGQGKKITDTTDVYNLYDLQYWWQRDKAAKDAAVTRIKAVMDAWTSPAKMIESVLTANATLLAPYTTNVGAPAGSFLFDLLLVAIPKHLAIAPPRVEGDPSTPTKIDKKYTVFCACDVGKSDNCCGPDVGVLPLRQRVLGPPLPYLVKPEDLFSVICCLVEKRYLPAQDAATEAAAKLETVNADIKRNTDLVNNGLASFLSDGKAAIPAQPKCCDCEHETQKQTK